MSGRAQLEPWMLQTSSLPEDVSCLVVDLATWPETCPLLPRPPVPLIGVGSSEHTAAASCDVLAEPPFSLDAIIDAILAMPRPAAALCHLLRATEGMDIDNSLAMESLTFAALQGSEDHLRWRREQAGGRQAAPGSVLLEREGDRLRITLHRPAARNAIDRPMRDALREAFELVSADTTIARVELRGAGRFFSVGADLGEFGTTLDPITAHTIRMRTLPAHWAVRRADILSVHIQGGAVGSGLELAAFAGRVTCSPKAWFQLPELAMGILPGAGGCVSVPRRIGRQRAALMMLTGKRIAAETALQWGLVDEICEAQEHAPSA